MDALKISLHGDALFVEVRVTAGASRTAVRGAHDGRLNIALEAVPENGKANAALIALLANLLRIPKRQISLVRGQTSRNKTLALVGSSESAVRGLLKTVSPKGRT